MHQSSAQWGFTDASDPLKAKDVFKPSLQNGQPMMDFGDFDARYLAEIDPWEQSGRTGERAKYYEFSRNRLVNRLTVRFNSNACGLEVGCGYGYLTHMLAQRQFKMVGLDISETAIKRARIMHPGIEFKVADITAEDLPDVGQYHFLVLGECWWYVLAELRQTLENCLLCLHPGGLFILQQAFIDNQKYGRDIADGFDGALRLLMSRPNLRLVEAHYDDSGTLCFHNGLIFMRKVDA
jgi:SAM-dependent methyltransferase